MRLLTFLLATLLCTPAALAQGPTKTGDPRGDMTAGFVGGAVSVGTTIADDIKLCFGDTTCDFWAIYNSSSTQFEIWHTDCDGGGSDCAFMVCDDGTDDCSLTGLLTVSNGITIDGDDVDFAMGAGGTADFRMRFDGTKQQLYCSGNIVANASLEVGTTAITEDSGAIGCLVDMSVSATPVDGTEQSYQMCLDSNPIITVYSEADGAGAVDTWSYHQHAEAYLDAGSQAAGITVQNQWEQALGCSAGNLRGFTHSACTLTTADANSNGPYLVQYSVAGVGGGGKDYEFGVSIDDAIQSGCRSERTMGAAATQGSLSASCILDIAHTDAVKLEIRCTDAVTADFTYSNITLVLTRL